MLPEPIAVTLKVTNVLEHLHIPYLLGCSFASTVHGIVRTTQDSDILTQMGKEHLPAFIQALQAEFYLDEQMILDAIRRKGSFNIIHQETMFKVDIFISLQRPFERSEFSRAKVQQISQEPPAQAMVCTAEDIILAKLEWYRMGGEVSEQQWRDITGIIKVQTNQLDLDYLRIWAAQLKVSDLLEKALTASK